jgi:hypothetical protein
MLKLRYRYLKSYLKRINKTSTDLCRCGIKETADHLLLSCLNYSTFRPDCLKESKPLSQILNKKERRLEVLQFIRQTRIATRRWHLGREDEEGEATPSYG